MKLFLDTADISEIRLVARWGVLAGVTTNPTLFASVGGSYDVLADICKATPGPVSAEVVAEDAGIVRFRRDWEAAQTARRDQPARTGGPLAGRSA
jgi:transaldolase